MVGPAVGQSAAPSLQAAVVLDAATADKQQSALDTRRRLQCVKNSLIHRQRRVQRSHPTRHQDDGRSGTRRAAAFA